MSDTDKTISVRFYRTASGRQPVREWLKNLSPGDRLILGEDLKTVEYGWPIGMPTCRWMGDGLWEVRSTISDKRTTRIFFCIADGSMVLVHAFIKKTQRTPDHELHLARQRMKEVQP